MFLITSHMSSVCPPSLQQVSLKILPTPLTPVQAASTRQHLSCFVPSIPVGSKTPPNFLSFVTPLKNPRHPCEQTPSLTEDGDFHFSSGMDPIYEIRSEMQLVYTFKICDWIMASHSCCNLSHVLIRSVTSDGADTFYYRGELTDNRLFSNALFNK